MPSVDCHRVFIHGLEQRRLSFGRSAVDLVRQKNLGKYRSFGQHELIRLKVEKVRAKHVPRHQVRRELNASKGERQRVREALRKQGLRCTGHAFEQDMASGQHAGEHQVNRVFLTHHGFADFRLNCLCDATNAG